MPLHHPLQAEALYQSEIQKIPQLVEQIQLIMGDKTLQEEVKHINSFVFSCEAIKKIKAFFLFKARLASKTSLDMQEFSVDQLIENIQASLEGKPLCVNIKKKPVAVGLDILIYSIVKNLILNALKYGTSTEVVLDTDDQTVCIEISNQGPPLSEDLVVALETRDIDAARQAYAAQERTGFGFGLMTCYKLVKSFSGALTYRYDGSASRVIFALRFSPTMVIEATQAEALRIFFDKEAFFAHEIRNHLFQPVSLKNLLQLQGVKPNTPAATLVNLIARLQTSIDLTLNFIYYQHWVMPNISYDVATLEKSLRATFFRLTLENKVSNPLFTVKIPFPQICAMIEYYLETKKQSFKIELSDDNDFWCFTLPSVFLPKKTELEQYVHHLMLQATSCTVAFGPDGLTMKFAKIEMRPQQSAKTSDPQVRHRALFPTFNHPTLNQTGRKKEASCCARLREQLNVYGEWVTERLAIRR